MNQAAFESFSINMVEAITRALESQNVPVDINTVMERARNIELFVIEYLTLLAQRHNAMGYQDCVSEIETALNNQSSQYPTSYTTRFVDRQALALWHYCKNESILDSAGSRLFTILEYDPDYREVLISSLAPIIQKLFGENNE